MTSPVVRSRFATSDFDRAREVLSAAYGTHDSILHGDPERFFYDVTATEIDGLRVDHTDYDSEVESHYSPFDDVLVAARLRRGALRVDDGQHRRVLGAGDLFWAPPGRAQHLVTEDVSFDFARLDVATLGRVASGLSGMEPTALRFHPGAPVSEERVRYWAATRRWVADRVLADEAIAAEPLVRAEALHALARATLLAVPNTALDALTEPGAAGPDRAEPAVVRRAIEFMEENVRRDIDISQIAAAARIGPRGLQTAFRKHRDQTPLEYLRSVRMDGAHRDLQAADPTRGDTVAAVAARWGFTHPGRFSVEYRRVHGRPPGETLRR